MIAPVAERFEWKTIRSCWLRTIVSEQYVRTVSPRRVNYRTANNADVSARGRGLGRKTLDFTTNVSVSETITFAGNLRMLIFISSVDFLFGVQNRDEPATPIYRRFAFYAEQFVFFKRND